MRKFLLFAFALIAVSFCIAQTKTESGWIKLFDGVSIKGWHSYGKPTAGSAWRAENGILFLDAVQKKDRCDLVTDEEFENFHLKLEWKISKNGNSGIIFLVHEDTIKYDYTFRTGPEMQVLDNDGHPDGKIHKHRAGDLYDLIASSSEPVKPVGEWNLAEVVVNKGNLELLLNGVTVVKTFIGNDDWKKMVANSKFKTMPGFGIFKTGHIALQDHGNDVWFKNIEIKKL